MESFISTAVFAVLFFASGVVSQTGTTGQVCNTGNTCIATTTDVCGVNSICRRKVDATCASPYQNQCVMGAQCNGTTATCQCKTPAYVAGSTNTDVGRCVPSPNFVGGTCSSTGTDRGTCWDTNSACGTSGVCVCKAGYVRNTDGNTCVLGPSGGLGQVCNTALTCNTSTTDICGVNNICRRKVDATCASPNQNLCVLGAQCDLATTTCKCRTPTYMIGSGIEVGRCVPSPNYVGGTCSGSSTGTDRGTCLDTNAVCFGGLCTCKTSYIRNTDSNTCVLAPTGGTGQICSSGNTCTATTTDVCGVNSICRRKVDATCGIPYTNLCVLGAQCDSATITCKCKTPTYMVGSGTDSGRCVPSQTYVGGTCAGQDRGTCLDASALCTNGFCVCRTGWARNTDGNTCMIGRQGTTGQTCNFGSTPCNANTTDICELENNICKRRADATCADPDQNQCLMGAQCDSTTTTCRCRTPYFYAGTSGIDSGKCLPSPSYLGGACTGPGRGTCQDSNAVCTNGVCQCKTSYVRNNDTYTCYVLTGGTGQMCNPGSTCNATATDVCDKNNYCKRRLGANCAFPNDNQCVLGAQCDSRTQTCACWIPYYTTGTGMNMGKCVPAENYVGGSCAGTDKGTCLDRNAVCSGGVCTCKTNYVRNTDYNACNGANGQTGGTGQLCNFGNTCNATTTDVCENTVCKRRLGANCAIPNDNQCVLGAQCDSRTQTCACWLPYYTTGTGMNMGKCVPAENYVGGSCAGTDKGTCLDRNAVCSGGVCTCKTNYVRNTDYNACNGANGQTGGTGQLCNFGNTCNAPTTDVCENTVCKRKAGVNCASPYQDQCVLGAQCDANFCRCKTPQYTVGTSGANLGKCVPSQNYVGGACSGPDRGTCQDPNAVCSSGVCACKTSSITTTDSNTCDACSVTLSVTLMLLGLIVTSRFL